MDVLVFDADRFEVAVGALGPALHAPVPDRTGLVVGYGTPAEHAFPAALDALGRQALHAAAAGITTLDEVARVTAGDIS